MGRLKFLDNDDRPEDGKTPLTDHEGLIVDIQTRDELNALEFFNINKAHEKYLLRRPSIKKAPFTYAWFLKVHREMYEDVWVWAGMIRKSNKNIGIDKSQVREALKALEKDYHVWIESKMNRDEAAARLHHRLVWIHPFENGNGRWARLIANIYLKQNDLPLIVWPEKELLEKGSVRKQYLEALRKADEHDLKSLIALQKTLQGVQGAHST